MGTESLAEALKREHREIDDGIAAFSASPADTRPLTRAIWALRCHIYLEEEFLFPLSGEAEPALRAPVFVMLREHAPDLHHNTVRFHLDALVEEGLVARAGARRCLRRGHQLRRAALYVNFVASVDGVTAVGRERPSSGTAVSGSCGAASRRPSVVTNGSQLPCGEERDNSCLRCPPLSAGMVCSMPRDAIPALMCG
jgi:DNA-binding transcriptional ArsR family regulator